MKRLFVVLLFSAAGRSVAVGQTTSDATLQALLAEVKQLRVALEKSAMVVPQAQLTIQRMQLQQQTVSQTSRELQEVRSQLAKDAAEVAAITGQAADLEVIAARESDPASRRRMEDQAKSMKAIKADYQKESQLRVRESELASRLRNEQVELDNLAAKLTVLDRLLEFQPSR